jgi:hypothetical protein
MLSSPDRLRLSDKFHDRRPAHLRGFPRHFQRQFTFWQSQPTEVEEDQPKG